jgi:hypothetical protein
VHWTGIAVLLLLAVCTAAGWRTGLVRRVLEFAGLVASLLLATRYGGEVAALLVAETGLSPGAAAPVGWALLFVALLAATRLLAWAVAGAVRVSVLGWLDRWGGAALGLLAGVLVGSVLLMLLCRLAGDGELRRRVREEPVTRLVHGAAPALYELAGGDRERVSRLWTDARERLPELPDVGGAVDAVRDAVGERADDGGS